METSQAEASAEQQEQPAEQPGARPEGYGRAGARATERVPAGDAVLVTVARSRGRAVGRRVDEHFAGFGELGAVKTVVLNVSGMTRMISFGVRQWLKAMDALPWSITDHRALNFGGASKDPHGRRPVPPVHRAAWSWAS